jgi:hypothetical protein
MGNMMMMMTYVHCSTAVAPVQDEQRGRRFFVQHMPGSNQLHVWSAFDLPGQQVVLGGC